MTKFQKAGLILLTIVTVAYVKMSFFSDSQPHVNPDEEQTQTEQTVQTHKASENVPKEFVNVYFLGQNAKKEDVYKVVKRPYDSKKDGTKINASINDLLRGPTRKESSHGIYSEIPANTKLLTLEEKPKAVIINLSSDFEQGGGTDGTYKRLHQLIKTANKNSSTDVYLYINGKQVDVVGGEGIMINQPLSEKSLDE